jgi:hypothetical protein
MKLTPFERYKFEKKNKTPKNNSFSQEKMQLLKKNAGV